ncbi:MAG: HAD family phosphatase [Nitrospira sp.]|nr:HAD family phosphatase [Nitrospira sp.]
MFAAAIFDMDGLLLDSERVIMQAWLDAARECGVHLSPADYLPVVGKADVESDAMLASLLGGPNMFCRVMTRVEELLARQTSEPIFPLKPGAQEILSALHVRQVPCAVASSTHIREIERRLRTVGVRDYFSAVSGGNEVFRGKPDPAVYELSANRLGVSPEACLAFEDSEHGIAAATAAGMRVVMVPDLKLPSAHATERLIILNTLHEPLNTFRCGSVAT